MVDKVGRATRSRIMSRISKKWSRIDQKVHGVLKSAKVHHTMYPNTFGSPDVFVPPNTLLFLDGCFWHCCPRCFRPPKSRVEYWQPKLAGNKLRDRRISRALRREGWIVIRTWEHEITRRPEAVLTRLRKPRPRPKLGRTLRGAR